jgi:signal transduction histidine kinase
MRRQLVMMAVSVSSMILIALLVPMAVLIERFAVEDALAEASLEVQATESVVSFRERSDLVNFVDTLNENAGHRTTVLFADGDVIGPDADITDDVRRARETGQAISNDTERGIEILVPVSLGRGSADPEADAPPDPSQVAVIRVLVSDGVINHEVLVSWAIIAVLGLTLLLLSIAVADRLARRLLRPVSALAATAEHLEAGRLDARAAIEGPAELRDVGHALNRLASRIGELLAAERESVADVSHRLRTPIAAVRLEADRLADPSERMAMVEGIDEVSRELSHVIQEARRPIREGLGTGCDAARIVRQRTDFWSALAEDQHRQMRVRIPEHPVPVNLAPADLATAVDALLENVFAHTAEGVAFDVHLTAAANGSPATLVVADRGAGFGGPPSQLMRGNSETGSTGLGLDIARRTTEASGGSLVIVDTPDGARVTARLGAANLRTNTRT